MTLSILVVDDDETIRQTLIEFFETFGYTVRGAATATEARQRAAEDAPDVVLLDLRLPDADGVVTLDAIRADDPDVGVILLTAYADVRIAVRAMQHGAADVLEKPVDLELLAAAVQRAAERARVRQELALLRARDRADDRASLGNLAPTLAQLIELAVRNADVPILLQGETGTGKGFVARQIHDRSSRGTAPFVEINCASLSSTFFESELYGHERGAFTDAKTVKRGLLEVAGNGTVFLDEVAELPLDVQPKLLKVIEDRAFRRLGGTVTHQSSARLIVATHKPLEDEVLANRFRADLRYRLQVLTLTLPPLRERIPDIVPLAMAALPRGATLSEAARLALVAYPWPGNIRELKNTVWRAALLADGTPIQPSHLGLTSDRTHPRDAASRDAAYGADPVADHIHALSVDSASMTLEQAERRAIAAALEATAQNRTQAAKLLGIARSTLLEKLKRT